MHPGKSLLRVFLLRVISGFQAVLLLSNSGDALPLPKLEGQRLEGVSFPENSLLASLRGRVSQTTLMLL